MRYLFLDTESSNCFNNIYKLCEYGFVTTDESFNPIPGGKRDVLIHPGEGRDARFNLVGRKDGRDLVLAHAEEEYFAANPFDDHYDNLKFLLSQEGLMIFLWAGENDIQALLDNCYRYRLPKFSFVSYDVQRLYKTVMKPDKTPSLEKAMEALGIRAEGIVAHRPDDDSLMTMLILKALCEKARKSVDQLISECQNCAFDSIPAYQKMQKQHREKVRKRITDEKEKARLKPFNDELNALLSLDDGVEYDFDHLFSVSLEMKRHIDETLPSIKDWIAKGYKLKRNLAVKQLVVYNEEEKANLMQRLDTTNLTIVTISEFAEIVA